ncbi:hypothetical protein ACFPM0_15520 [Pseudonocardia sulfidoxydans]|uniref:hypothetical protein n=1 Tax=Pseudonocardia sulfidoxydans TaxID=54011 RepID=UPI0036168C83
MPWVARNLAVVGGRLGNAGVACHGSRATWLSSAGVSGTLTLRAPGRLRGRARPGGSAAADAGTADHRAQPHCCFPAPGQQ